uniref:Uncharacterized protein n=1 Tax=Arundo donax TaxID=35708 RepID=A0A0A9AU29_ARUDO
MTSFFQIACFL